MFFSQKEYTFTSYSSIKTQLQMEPGKGNTHKEPQVYYRKEDSLGYLRKRKAVLFKKTRKERKSLPINPISSTYPPTSSEDF